MDSFHATLIKSTQTPASYLICAWDFNGGSRTFQHNIYEKTPQGIIAHAKQLFLDEVRQTLKNTNEKYITCSLTL